MDDKQRAFQEFERSGWEEAAGTYSESVAPMTAQLAPALLDAAAAGEGRRVLDVATGPGFVAAAAAERGASAVGLDIAAAMVAEASRRHPHIEFRQGAAEELPFEDGAFDGVVSALGMPHFADHAAFFRESYRVLRGGGRIAFATWLPPERNPYVGIVLGAIAERGTLEVPGLPEGPGFFELADPTRSEAALQVAGFAAASASEVTLELRIKEGAAGLLRFLRSGSVRSRALYEGQTDEARAGIEQALEESLAPYRSGEGFRVPAGLILVSARRP